MDARLRPLASARRRERRTSARPLAFAVAGIAIAGALAALFVLLLFVLPKP